MSGKPRKHGRSTHGCPHPDSRPPRSIAAIGDADSLTVRFTTDELVRLRAACTLSGISVHGWCRHVVFGDPLPAGRHVDDDMALDRLTRIGALTLIVRDLVERSDAPGRVTMVDHLRAIAQAVLDVERRIARPYRREVIAPADGDGDDVDVVDQSRCAANIRIRCPIEAQRDAVRAAAAETGLSVAAWLRAVIARGGMPQPVRPHATAVARQFLPATIVTLTDFATKRDPDAIRDALAARGADIAATIRECAGTDGASTEVTP